jgi:hypothetical protein
MAGESEVKMSLEASEKAMRALYELMRLINQRNRNNHRSREENDKSSGASSKDAGNKSSLAPGEVSQEELKNEADRTKTEVKTRDNIAKSDVPDIVRLAKAYGISVAVVDPDKKNPDGNVTITYRASDSAVFEQVMKDVVKERLQKDPDAYASFKLNESEARILKDQFDKNGISADFVKDAQGSFHCIYKNSDFRTVDTIKNNFFEAHKNIAENFNFKKNEDGGYVFVYRKQEFTVDELTEAGLKEKFTGDIGMSDIQAQMAVDRFRDGLPPDELFVDKSAPKVEIAEEVKLRDENLLVAGIGYYHVKLEGEPDTFIIIDDKGQATFLEQGNDDKNLERLRDMGLDEKIAQAMLDKHNQIAGGTAEEIIREESLTEEAAEEVIREEDEIIDPDIPEPELGDDD